MKLEVRRAQDHKVVEYEKSEIDKFGPLVTLTELQEEERDKHVKRHDDALKWIKSDNLGQIVMLTELGMLGQACEKKANCVTIKYIRMGYHDKWQRPK